jgi:Ca2+-binding EF-hand superfamily protein
VFREYRGVSALKRAAMNILVKMADTKEIEELREIFLSIDTETTGYITVEELA